MKKGVKIFIIAWAVLLAAFNLIAFAFGGFDTVAKYTSPTFWIAYGAIMITFGVQLASALYAFRAESSNKKFYNISLIRIGYVGLILSFIWGGLCMLLFPLLTYWITLIVCLIIVATNVISILKAAVAVDMVEKVDEKLKTQTFFIRALASDAETVMAQAKSDEAKAECKKVYEAIRYSDPMSNNALREVESEIADKFTKFSKAVSLDDVDMIKELACDMIVTLENRNNSCKLLK